jgi:hypothetical protein
MVDCYSDTQAGVWPSESVALELDEQHQRGHAAPISALA